MQPDHLSSAPRRGSVLRYALLLVALVLVIGGIAWVAQNLPKKGTETKPPPPVNELMEFPRSIAQWDEQKPDEKKDGTTPKEKYFPKEVEFGTEGHYDFPFKIKAGHAVDVLQYVSTCDCTSVRVCALPMAEWAKIVEQQKLKPGEPLKYDREPAWLDLQSNRDQGNQIDAKKVLTVKPDEGGVVRIRWTVKKTPGQILVLEPYVVFRPAGESDIQTWKRQKLMVPVQVGTAIRFEPALVRVGLLAPGCKPVIAEFDAWSATREKFDLKLTPLPANPFFDIETRPLSAKECADLAANMKGEGSAPRVRSGHHVTVTVHETKDGKQLDQGPFYQKLAIHLDGLLEPELSGPEIVGRVQGDVRIGGTDDQGKIRFKAFQAGETAIKTVELLADAKLELKTHTHDPPWLEVKVTRYKDQPDPKQHRWRLQVTVPANTPGVRSFEESDHVTLRIVGSPDRFVRIALEGHLSGR
jgi:hypothetical protein